MDENLRCAITRGMNYDDWPDCPVEGCTNKVCLALDSEYCFPHTPGNEHVKRMDIDARRIIAGLETEEQP